MFCQHCGVEVTHDLNYCTRCGGSLGPQELAPRPHVSALSVWGIGMTTLFLVVGGMAVLFGFIFGLSRESRLPAPALTFLALFGVVMILGSVGMLTRLWRLLLTGANAQQAPPRPAQLPRPSATNELPPARASFLPEAFGPAPSVTEHTTRTFDAVRREPRAR